MGDTHDDDDDDDDDDVDNEETSAYAKGNEAEDDTCMRWTVSSPSVTSILLDSLDSQPGDVVKSFK